MNSVCQRRVSTTASGNPFSCSPFRRVKLSAPVPPAHRQAAPLPYALCSSDSVPCSALRIPKFFCPPITLSPPRPILAFNWNGQLVWDGTRASRTEHRYFFPLLLKY